MSTTNFYAIGGLVLAESSGGSRIDYLPDAQGSVVGTCSSTSAVTSTHRYSPYGLILAETGASADVDFKWTGQQGYMVTGDAHSDTYVRARHYAPEEGQWTSLDPIWPSQPAYAYVLGNPTSLSDPSGLANSCRTKDEDHGTDCQPQPQSYYCCKPNISCFLPPPVGPGGSRAYFSMTLAKDPVATLNTTGTLRIEAWYRVSYSPTKSGVTCPGPTTLAAVLSVNAYSGASGNQYTGSWCNADAGPIPPSNLTSPAYSASTSCSAPDDERMMLGSEGFKFRINEGGQFRIQGCRNTRSHFAIHMDGVRDPDGRGRVRDDLPRNGSAGCIVFGSAGVGQQVRNCMHWLNKYGCSSIPLTVTY